MDLKEMTSYKGYILRYPIYTSRSTQQIYDYNKNIKSCDANGRVIVDVLDERNTFSGFRYARFKRSMLLKANNDYDKEKEKEAPCYRYFDEHHQPFQ